MACFPESGLCAQTHHRALADTIDNRCRGNYNHRNLINAFRHEIE
jgi:hypothetical protein